MATYEQYCRLVAPHLVRPQPDPPQPARLEPEKLLSTLIADLVKRTLEGASDKPDIVDVVPAPFCEECGHHESFEINSINRDRVMCANCGAIRSIKE